MKVQTWPEYPASRTWILRALTAASLIGMAVAVYLSLFYVGMDKKQGNVQRVFMHVGLLQAATAFLSPPSCIAYDHAQNGQIDWPYRVIGLPPARHARRMIQ
jgi:hypothetical protein